MGLLIFAFFGFLWDPEVAKRAIFWQVSQKIAKNGPLRKNAVRNLKIEENVNVTESVKGLDVPIDAALNKFQSHPSILKLSCGCQININKI